MNSHIADTLNQLVSLYRTMPDKGFQTRALLKAIKSIKEYPSEIDSEETALEVPGVGKGIAQRIAEILETGTLAELDQDSYGAAVAELTKVTGIGPKKALLFAQAGIDSVEALRKAHIQGKVRLTHHMEVGLNHYEDLLERIPREEVDRLAQTITGILPPGIIFEICGSYRRGAPTCGDIDILITEPGSEEPASEALTALVERLGEMGILIDSLTFKGGKKYMGVALIDQLARRIDIRYIPWSAFYPALVYFTGSKNFNIKIRKRAIEMGYSLSEYGLKGYSEPFPSEEALFQFLGLDYVPPTEREMGK